MQDSLINILENIGLSSKEAKVYLACIESGTAAVSKIAKLAKINRITTYDILDKLKKRGLVSFYSKNKIRYFTGTKPDIIVEDFERRASDFKNALPKFKEIMGEGEGSRVRYFEGAEGVKSAYYESLLSGDEILSFSNHMGLLRFWPEYEKDYMKKRAKKELYFRSIRVDDRKPEIIRKEDGQYYMESRIMPEAFFVFDSEILVYDDNVAVFSLGEEMRGVIYESRQMALSFHVIFEMAWQYCAGGVIEDPEELKNKMFTPLKGSELHRSIANLSKPLTHDRKEVKEDNLSMF